MAVVLSHVGISFLGYNPGIVAVISFFLLSGYVMTGLIEKHYKHPSSIPVFYLDRVARLFPQFLFYMMLASALVYVWKVDSPFINQLTFIKWVLNFFMLPQGFFMYWADGALVIPQSWSLGLELTFYLVIPWILVYCSRKQIYILAGLSFLIFTLAYLGKINTDNFGYRLLPGTLFMFLIGSLLFYGDKAAKLFIVSAFVISAVMLLAALRSSALYALSYNKEVLIGLLIGILVVGVLKAIKNFFNSFSNIDEFFGNLSYGLFLNHFIVIWAMGVFFGVKEFNFIKIAILLLTSCALALLTFYYIERPLLIWRRALRCGVKKHVLPIYGSIISANAER